MQSEIRAVAIATTRRVLDPMAVTQDYEELMLSVTEPGVWMTGKEWNEEIAKIRAEKVKDAESEIVPI